MKDETVRDSKTDSSTFISLGSITWNIVNSHDQEITFHRCTQSSTLDINDDEVSSSPSPTSTPLGQFDRRRHTSHAKHISRLCEFEQIRACGVLRTVVWIL